MNRSLKKQELSCIDKLKKVDIWCLNELYWHSIDRGYPLSEKCKQTCNSLSITRQGILDETDRLEITRLLIGNGFLLRFHKKELMNADSVIISSKLNTIESSLYTKSNTHNLKGNEAILRELALSLFQVKGKITGGTMLRWTVAASTFVGIRERMNAELQRIVAWLEKKFCNQFSRDARALLLDFIAIHGGKTTMKGLMPLRRTSAWIMGPHPLHRYQSDQKLPTQADVVIIGAGLTGASAAWHLMQKKEKLKVVLLDAGDHAQQASGRNGGNFELIPENFFGGYGTYDGLVEERFKFLKQAYPKTDDTLLKRHAEKTAKVIVRFALKNAKAMLKTIKKASIECDVSKKGWLRLATNQREENALKAEVKFAAKLGADIHLISAKKILEKYGLPAKFQGRIVYSNGNYHPYKFVTGELVDALRNGLQLFTHSHVSSITFKSKDYYEVITSRGKIKARKVIVATNAFTSELFPELSDIRPFRSQIMNLEHVQNTLRGITMTAKDGDIYGNFPKGFQYRDTQFAERGMLHLGGGLDVEIRNAHQVEPSAQVLELSLKEAAHFFPQTSKQPPSRTWAGPMAFVEGKRGMRLPVLGPLGPEKQSGIFIAVWCNGYGGTGCHLSGKCAAEWAHNNVIPKEIPQDVFGPQRLFTSNSVFHA